MTGLSLYNLFLLLLLTVFLFLFLGGKKMLLAVIPNVEKGKTTLAVEPALKSLNVHMVMTLQFIACRSEILF